MKSMLIDTHSHINFSAFLEDRDEVIKNSLDQGIWMINVGSNWETSKIGAEIAEKWGQGVFSAIGLHPIHIKSGLAKRRVDDWEGQSQEGEEFEPEKYRKLAQAKKVIAIGEIGLDYYYKPKSKAKFEIFKQNQKEVFVKQLELAQELNLAVIFHCRMAHSDLLELLKDKKARGVIHCFTGNWDQAEKYIDKGFYLGFTGIIFKLALDEIIKKTPLEKMLIETDCPYLVPPLPSGVISKNGRNEPRFVKYIAERIAEIKEESYEEVAEVTFANARALFDI